MSKDPHAVSVEEIIIWMSMYWDLELTKYPKADPLPTKKNKI